MGWREAYSVEALARRAAVRATPEYRAAAAERSRRWYSTNTERARASRKAYRERNKARLQAAAKARYESGGRERDRQYRAARRAVDPVYADRVRNNKRKWNGLPAATRPCPVGCEACGRKSKRGALCLDHDHTTGAFRGWLCDRCNRAAGLLGDKTTGVRLLLVYLEKHS